MFTATEETANQLPILDKGWGQHSHGSELAALLEGVDRRELDGYSLIHLVKARSRQLAQVQAAFFADLVEIADAVADKLCQETSDDRWQYCSDEIRAALAWNRRAAEYQLARAEDLIRTHPEVGEALARGDIDYPKAKAICDEIAHLDAGEARRVSEAILPVAANHTTGQIRHRIQRMAMAADPEQAEKRYRTGVEDRRVVLEANPDGTANLLAYNLPSDLALAARGNIEELARRSRKADARTADQRRADALLGLLLGEDGARAPEHPDASIELRVELETLLGLGQQPGELGGYGPLVAQVTREIAEQARSWDVHVTDHGELIWSGRAKRRPGNHLRRLVSSRNPVCAFPGCRMPAAEADLDHRDAWSEGGPTTVDNLTPLCRHDHRLKHDGGWAYRPDSEGGWLWTSPLGHEYRSPPSLGP